MTAPRPDQANQLPAIFRDLNDLFECPQTRKPVQFGGGTVNVAGSPVSYPVKNAIPNFFVPASSEHGIDVTDLVKQFYEETPFPNYDDFDSRESLAKKAIDSVFAAMLDEQIPHGAIVLEAGCGTGQLTNFLGMSWKRRVFGGDICLNSLGLAEAFRKQYSIRNAGFLQMNLFRPPFRDESFDLIVSNGVLHHTGDPAGGISALAKKLKPGGIISVGLYNSYARLPTLWRRKLFERFGQTAYVLDSRLRQAGANEARMRAWFMDQYKHPHESKHSMDEVLRWFSENGIEFLCGIPQPNGTEFSRQDRLFERHEPGTSLDRFLTQLWTLLAGGKDGGLFIMIGRKRG
jgi:SAM-dependent methyltransferase